MPTPIAELFIAVSADVSSATRQLNGLSGSLDKSASGMKAARPAAIALTAAGGGLAAGIGGAISVAADFEQQMANVRAVMSPSEINTFGTQLNELALKLGQDTKFSALEAGEGIEELIKAGVSSEAVMGGAAKAALDLAAATGIPVSTAATLAAQSMNAFGKDASQLSGVVDFLAGTANASAADMGQLKLGLSAVGSVARPLGLEDTATALGLFANNALVGSDAGTSLKTMLMNLQPSTKAQRKLFRELGLTAEDGSNAFYDAEGNMRSLSQIAGVLQTALGDMTQQQRDATLEQLFGSDAIRAAGILTREGAQGVDTLAASIGKIAASDVAATRLATTAGAADQMASSFETAQVKLGSTFLPMMVQVLNTLTGVANAFLSLPPSVQSFIAIGAAVVAALLLIGGGLVLIIPAIAALGTAFGALGGLMALALGPVGLIILAIIAVIVLLKVAWENNFLGIQEITATVFEFIGNAFEGLKTFVGELVGWIGNLFSTLDIGAILTTVLLGPLGPLFAAYKLAWENNFLGIQQITERIFGFITAIIDAFLKGPLGQLGASIGAVFEQLGKVTGGGTFGAPAPAVAPLIPAGGPAGGAAGGGGGNVVIEGPINIASEVDADLLLLRMASTVEAAAGRANLPPDNSAFPGLVPVA